MVITQLHRAATFGCRHQVPVPAFAGWVVGVRSEPNRVSADACPASRATANTLVAYKVFGFHMAVLAKLAPEIGRAIPSHAMDAW
jgi:hypothetical protein